MMGLPKYDSGLCFDAASAPDRERLAGPAVDPPPVSWGTPSAPAGVISELWDSSDKGNPVETWKAANGYGGGAVTGTKVSGTGDTITQGTPAILDDAAGAFIATMRGGALTISGATSPGNNGLFQITAVNGPTQLEYANPDAVTVTEAFSYGINQADGGYGADPLPTKSWRYDVDLSEGWYTRSTTNTKYSGRQ